MDFNYWLIKGSISIAIFATAKLIYWFFNDSINKIDKYAETHGLNALDITENTKKSIAYFSKYLIYSVAFFGVLYVFELNDILTGILTAAGVSGIAIGFAAKDLISNSLSGIMLIFDRPFKIGDYVKIGRFIDKGTIQSIGIRNTVIKSRSGEIITVPNSTVLNETVTNFSTPKSRLVELIVELDVDADVAKALKFIDKMLEGLPWRYNNRSEVYVSDVNKENVILTIKVWIASKKYGERKTELFYKVRDLLKRHKIKSSVIRE